MKKYFISMLCSMFIAGSALAAVTVNTDGLSEAQKAELVQMAEKLKENNAEPVEVKQEALDKWAKFGVDFGKVISSTAKEVGIAVNDFVKTPVGQMTAAVIVYKYIGADLIHLGLKIFGAFTILAVGLALTRKLYIGFTREKITYNVEKKNIFGNHPILAKEYAHLNDDETWFLTIVTAATIIAFSFALF